MPHSTHSALPNARPRRVRIQLKLCSFPGTPCLLWCNVRLVLGIRGSKSHEDPDVLALLQSGPAAVSVDAGPYNEYHGGVLNCSAEGQHHVDHANALVGYGVQPPPKRCPEQPKNASCVQMGFLLFCCKIMA